jgi:hypothetical protein
MAVPFMGPSTGLDVEVYHMEEAVDVLSEADEGEWVWASEDGGGKYYR